MLALIYLSCRILCDSYMVGQRADSVYLKLRALRVPFEKAFFAAALLQLVSCPEPTAYFLRCFRDDAWFEDTVSSLSLPLLSRVLVQDCSDFNSDISRNVDVPTFGQSFGFGGRHL